MKNRKQLGILFFFVVIASTLFASISEKSRQGVFSIFEDLQPASEPPETVSNAGDQPPGTVSIHQHIQFTGRRYSTATGLFFNRNRYYSPQVGRFISRDRIGFGSGNNPWSYANQNPILHIDSNGMYLEFPESWDQMRIETFLRANYPFAYANFMHSLEANPRDLFFTPESSFSLAIKQSDSLRGKLVEIIRSSSSDEIDTTVHVQFDFPSDFFFAMHGADVSLHGKRCSGKTEDMAFSLDSLVVSDFYNFEEKGWEGLFGPPPVAQMVVAAGKLQKLGLIHPFKWKADIGKYTYP
ncbi:MAG: RHS repeat-associated core domain-containing protein [Candidatus Riflebacteria bacterium]|nr:RHS repeat-associated core domain-containing protein [Candidatus Riflebacteria bacterium]